ncbi:hypothetical protein FACS189493_4680 [Spirochaetia bacterium]|nr:hypothetical protein FACS189493_4680 [Spirochaetia bacterium]
MYFLPYSVATLVSNTPSLRSPPPEARVPRVQAERSSFTGTPAFSMELRMAIQFSAVNCTFIASAAGPPDAASPEPPDSVPPASATLNCAR